MKSSNIIYLVVAVVLLVGLFIVFKSQNQTSPTEQLSNQQATSSAGSSPSAEQSNVKTFELIIKERKLVSGPETIQVTEGDEVAIKVTADETEEFHLHGYDKSVDLEKDIPTELKFSANLTGRFPYELEKSKTEIGALEVQPK